MANVVEIFAGKFSLRPPLRKVLSSRCSLFFRPLCLLSLLAIVVGSAVAGVNDQNPPANHLAPGLPFAIADFDGDHRPDLASIQAEQTNSGTTDYWIQLQLSTSGRQSFRLAAPPGGLLIEARDVNGDRAVDLVLVTAWFKTPVAIFLNDGHGGFSRAQPADFPAAFLALAPEWTSPSDREMDSVGFPPQSRAGLSLQADALQHFRQRGLAITLPNAGFPVSSFVISHAGRAPPSELHHL
jgi:hypothetical protein